MSTLAQELDEQLRQMDPETARHVEQLVREALLIASRRPAIPDPMGYPIAYFEKTAGSFADQPLERPSALPPECRPSW